MAAAPLSRGFLRNYIDRPRSDGGFGQPIVRFIFAAERQAVLYQLQATRFKQAQVIGMEPDKVDARSWNRG